ncbi:MAG: hypothetical protein Q9168_004963 [Polycauliona sp. 1 TL-2023]
MEKIAISAEATWLCIKSGLPRCTSATSSALPAVRQNVPGNSVLHVPFPRVEQLITNLLRWTRAQQDIRIRQATLRFVFLKVDNSPEPFNPTRSSNFQDFRNIGCMFRAGGPPSPPHDVILFRNRWPQNWDQWDLAPMDEEMDPDFDDVHTIDFELAARRMSAEFANQLLKAHGFRGRYGAVILENRGSIGLGWCFDSLELEGEEEIAAKLVTIPRGEVLDVEHCILGDF